MIRDKDQKMRFNKAELSVIKGLFAGNEDLLFAIRKVLLQFALSERDEVIVHRAITRETFPLIKKFFLPDLDPEAPLFQMTDMWLGVQGDLKQPVDLSWPYIEAKELEIKYINQQLNQLLDLATGNALKPAEIRLSELTKIGAKPTTKAALENFQEKIWVNLNARNYILSFVDSNLQQIKFLAGLKEETVEETLSRLEKNSNK